MKFSAIAKPSDKIIDVIKLMNSSTSNKHIAGFAVVTDSENKVLACVTDGDIRRGLAGGSAVEASIDTIANVKPIMLPRNLSKQQMRQELIRLAKNRQTSHLKYQNIIITEADGTFADVIQLESIIDTDVSTQIVGVYGLGFVGLTLGCVLANNGIFTVGIETNATVVSQLQNGRPHIFENGLESILHSLSVKNPIHFTSDATQYDIDIHIVCVGTPIDNDHKPDLSAIALVVDTIGNRLKKDDLIIFRSTVPAGTMRNFVMPRLAARGYQAGRDYHIAFAPERTVEGNAIEELQTLPQIIGGFDNESTERAARLFQKITRTIVEVESLEAAELIKLMNNTYRDLVFSFANEAANICEQFNLNAFKLIEAANEGYPRNKIPKPSPGVGGLCLTKDPHLYSSLPESSTYKPVLGKASRSINSKGADYVLNKIRRFADKHHFDANKMRVLIIGLAFKGMPETSDTRDSVALQLLQVLPNRKNIRIKDFVVSPEEITRLGCIPVANLMDGFKNTDVCLVMNNHYMNNRFNIFDALQSMNRPAMFFDGWNMFNQKEIEGVQGVTYTTLGYETP